MPLLRCRVRPGRRRVRQTSGIIDLSTNRTAPPRVPSSAVERRLVVVGGAHSGAHLVRELLGALPGVQDLGDTGVFAEVVGRARFCRPWTLLGLSSGHERRMLGRLQTRTEDHGAGPVVRLPPRDPRLPRCFAGAVAMLDRMALSAGLRSWVEHTPGVADGLARLERLVPRVHVVHVVRDGRDVVAEHCLRAAGRRDGRCRGIDARLAIAHWNRAVAAQARLCGRPGHSFVLYQDLMADPATEIIRLLRECGMQHGSQQAPTVRAVLDAWPVAEPAGGGRHDLRLRFREWFSAARRRRIERGLHLDRYGAFAERVRRQQSERGLPSPGGSAGATEPLPSAGRAARVGRHWTAADDSATAESGAP